MNSPNGIGMYNDPVSQPVLCNSIIWSGFLLQNGMQAVIDGSPVYTNCLIQGMNPGGTNLNGLTIDPQFVNPVFDANYWDTPGDYHLLLGNPCIDYGDVNCINGITSDLDGTARMIGSHPDLGVYEFDPTNPTPPNHPFHKNKGDEPIVQQENRNRVSGSDMKLSLYPNPAISGQGIRIYLGTESAFYDKPVGVQVFSIEGKCIYSQTHANGNSEWNSPELSAGIYLLKVQTREGKTYKAKMIVQ
jgi:hypothetical protein